MANQNYSEFKERKAVAAPRQGGTSKRTGNSPGFREKPAFPSAGLPGKAQPKNRSAGVRKATVYPKSEGI